jgi:hypothetical protein
MNLSELELEAPEPTQALSAADVMRTPLTKDWADTIWRSLVEEFEFDPENFDSDCIYKAIDGVVPIYYHEKWKLFSELAAWSHDEDCAAEYGRTATDLDAIADQLLDWCATRIANYYFSEIEEQVSDWEDEKEFHLLREAQSEVER